MIHEWVWIFNGCNCRFPSGVFESKEKSELWIKQYSLAGTITKYPMNISAYDYALKHGYFKPKKEHQKTPDFIGQFTAGFIDHDHYDDEYIPHIPDFDDAIDKTEFALNGWVWIFIGDGASFPGGVFETQSDAELWIKHSSLSGVLLKYPVGISAYAWAVDNDIFTPKDDTQRCAFFIATFGWGYTEHVNYLNGLRWGNEEIEV